MTLLITIAAVVAATLVWYFNNKRNELRLSWLCYMYWGASIMWFVDTIYEYAELGADYFTPEAADMLNDAFLGLAAVVLGLVIWLFALLAKDPNGVLTEIFKNKKGK